ncbi:hypothetical protein GCM10010361_67230 [Streptomyces olivaceiscleroticus]|uniref:Uncharacterized protein n=1 Tax=Streptomyces olivaceiscleroticus TaxID=68245 RepID=A0ABP3L5T0_9ACTN
MIGVWLTKTNGDALKAHQVQAYMDIAARRGYESVDDAVNRFHTSVVVHLDSPTSRRTPAKESTTTA